MFVVVLGAFAVDAVLKILARTVPTIVGRFSFTTGIGEFGIVPSMNDVLAFSLPIPNTWIWPIGWIVVFALIGALGRMLNFSAKGGYASGVKFQISNSHAIALLAIILGAVSNLIDRTVFGGVTDYVAFSDLYPAFNVADILIISGLVWWVLAMRTPNEILVNEKRTP